MVAVYHFLYGNALFTGTDGHGYTVLIATADKHHVLLLESEVTYIDVGGNVHASQVADVYTTVGIRQRGRNGGTLVILFHKKRSSLFWMQIYKIIVIYHAFSQENL